MTNKELINYLLITGKLETYYLDKALELANKNVNVAKFYTKLLNVGMTPELVIETLWNILKYTENEEKIELICTRLELIGYTFSKEITMGVWVRLIYRILDDLKARDKIEVKLNDKIEFNFYSESQRKKKITLGRKEYRVENDTIINEDRKPVYTNVAYIAIKDKDNFEVYSNFDTETFNKDKHRLKVRMMQ